MRGGPALVIVPMADWAERLDDDWQAARLACPVWQDTFSSRAGFPHDHAHLAGHLPWQRSELRGTLAEHAVALALGMLAFRLYLYDGGPLVEPGTRVAVVADDPEDVQRSRCEARGARPACRCPLGACGTTSATYGTGRDNTAPGGARAAGARRAAAGGACAGWLRTMASGSCSSSSRMDATR